MLPVLSLLLAIALLPQPAGVLRDAVDVVEVNHCYNENAVHQYDQIILWQWTGDDYRVRAWVLWKNTTSVTRDGQGGAEAAWQDRDLLRVVTAPSYRESWTCYDPEAADREVFPEGKRTCLSWIRVRAKGGAK